MIRPWRFPCPGRNKNPLADGFQGDLGVYISIPKNRVQKVDVVSSLLKKKIVVTLNNGEAHTFDYGMLSVQKIAEAINARSGNTYVVLLFLQRPRGSPGDRDRC